MKKNIIYIFLSLIILAGCNEGIDPITAVEPGPDGASPEVMISFPQEGTTLQVLEQITSIDIKFEVTDDIEIGSVRVLLDGNEIANYSDFIDYRRFLQELTYDQIDNGQHVLTVEATDLSGKTGSASVNFAKEPPYVPKYEGEVLYMPFDADYIDLVNIARPDIVGNPGFSDMSVLGSSSYEGAENAYLTFPTADIFGQGGSLPEEFSAAFWMNVNSTPDRGGVLVIGPPDPNRPADSQNNRTSGFRFFRENAGGMQRFKLNVGRGDGDSWFDGGAAADVAPNTGEWHHFAFTISQTEAKVYIDGQIVREGEFSGVDWTNCDLISIMSGEPRFSQWNHRSDRSLMDELRLFNRELSQNEIQDIIFDESGMVGYMPKYDGEVFYASFDDGFTNLVNRSQATVVGNPSLIAESVQGAQAYAGAEDSYLTWPTEGMLGEEFSAVFWMNINATPDRAGILVIGPQDPDKEPDAQNNRKSGFRFFRENAGGEQRFKLNVGRGDGDSWFDGGDMADVDPAAGGWHHFAFTISSTEAAVYIDGEIARQGEFSGVDWAGCDVLSVMSGAPRFVGWNHRSDQGYMDELRLFNKALTQEEIRGIISDEE